MLYGGTQRKPTMSSTPRDDDLGELFVNVTGESTLTEAQEQEHQSGRYDESRLSEEVTDIAQADGLEEAVDQPDAADIG